MLGYRVPRPDEALLVSGGKFGMSGAPFRVVTGHGAFVLPFVRKANFLTLAMCESVVSETCVTKQGISLNVRAVIAFKVGNDQESIVNAGQRFLSDQNQMSMLTGRIFAGHLRSIIGSMTVEEIVTERQKLAIEVLDGSKSEMAKIGLSVDSLQIQSIDDMKTAVVQAQYKAEVDKAQAEAAQAGPLAQAQAQMEVLAAQADLAMRQSELRERQLVAEVIKPAEAEAEKVQILARADALRVTMQAEVAASHNRVALDRMLIEQLPQIVKEAAAGLAGSNLSVLNGADGLSEIAAGLVSQGMTILDSVKKGLQNADNATPQSGNELTLPYDGNSP